MQNLEQGKKKNQAKNGPWDHHCHGESSALALWSAARRQNRFRNALRRENAAWTRLSLVGAARNGALLGRLEIVWTLLLQSRPSAIDSTEQPLTPTRLICLICATPDKKNSIWWFYGVHISMGPHLASSQTQFKPEPMNTQTMSNFFSVYL